MERRLAAILAADVVGYSRLMEFDEAGTLAALQAHRQELIDSAISQHRGRTVKLMGDGALVEFASVVDAVNCAIAIQTGMAKRNENVPNERRIDLRIGVHLGDIIVEGDDIYGDGVNVAARLEGLAEPGSVCLSRQAFDQVETKLDIWCEDLGEQHVKNISRPLQAYRIELENTRTGTTTSASRTLPLPDKPSIAVLPFTNMSGDPEQEYFSDGIAADIITELSRFRSLFVISRNSTFTLKGRPIEVREVGKRFGVQYVVEGSVRKTKERVRITAELIDATRGRNVWSERYDRPITDVFALQDEITEMIVAAIEPQLTVAERERALRQPPESLDAWELYHLGFWHLSRFNKEDSLKAKQCFSDSTELEPNFSRGHAGFAYQCHWDVHFGYADSPGKALENGFSAARRAVSLDDKDAFARFVLGRIYMLQGDQEAATGELERAIRLNPNFVYAYYSLGLVLVLTGRPVDAMQNIDRSFRLSPNDPHLWGFMATRALALLQSKQYEQAAKWARDAVRHPVAGCWPHFTLASSLGHLGRVKPARAALDNALALKPSCSTDDVQRAFPFNDAADLDHYCHGLRKAGLRL